MVSYIISKKAHTLNLLDRPKGLKDHSKPTPYGGGIAIFIASLIALFYGGDWRILLLGSGLFVMGLFDDIRPYSRYLKLILQSLIAITTILIGIRMEVVFFPEWLNILLSVIWIVGITNAFNIIDVMDGIAGGVGFFAISTFIFISILGTGSYPYLAISVAGGILGFMPYNLPKARLFMGDAGSLFIGYTIAAIALKTSYTTANPIALFVPLLILFYPIFDTVYVVSLRLSRRRNPLAGSPDHFVLKLKATGFPVHSIIAIIYLATLSLCEASFIITRLSLTGAIIFYSIACIIFVIFGVILKGRT